jgi:hypothetical protein
MTKKRAEPPRKGPGLNEKIPAFSVLAAILNGPWCPDLALSDYTARLRGRRAVVSFHHQQSSPQQTAPIVELPEGNGPVTTVPIAPLDASPPLRPAVSSALPALGRTKSPCTGSPLCTNGPFRPAAGHVWAAGAPPHISPIGQIGFRSRPGWPPRVAPPLR